METLISYVSYASYISIEASLVLFLVSTRYSGKARKERDSEARKERRNSDSSEFLIAVGTILHYQDRASQYGKIAWLVALISYVLMIMAKHAIS